MAKLGYEGTWHTLPSMNNSIMVYSVCRYTYTNIFAAIPDLVLVGIHVKPSDAQAELDGLVKVYEDAVKKFLTFNILLLGDMNADCSYISNRAYDLLNFTTDKRFLWLINKSKDTTVANTDCSYDR